MKRASRPLFLFYLLVVYVVLQFCWWTFLIADLNNQLYKERLKNSESSAYNQEELEKSLHKKWIMIGGEAFVFFGLLVAGIYKVRQSFKKEQAVIRQQKNFLLSVTHELKSPLASVRLQTETLKKHSLPKEKQEQVLGNTLKDIDRLDQLIENVLLVTRIENPKSVINAEEVNLSDYLVECLRDFQQLFKEALVAASIQERVYHKIDPLLFRSIILNLMENAEKYGATEIAVNLKEKDNVILINICDNGEGIPVEERENIFKIFYRIGNEETRKKKGTGLGLYIVKTLVEKHNGSISCRSNSPKGTIFEIQLAKPNA